MMEQDKIASQKHYVEAILQKTTEAYWIVDRKKNIIYVNDAFCRMTGYQREDILKMKSMDIYVDENSEVADAQIERIIQNGTETFESSLRCKSGDNIQVELSVSFLNIKDGRLIYFCNNRPASIAEQYPPESENYDDPSEKKLHILLVEDLKIHQKVINIMLNSLGHTVTIAPNGELAMELFQPGKFDLILMDIQMPVMDGATATQRLKEKYDDLPPIVGLSANAFEGDRDKYIAVGMDEYLTKPVIKNDFKRLINKIMPRPENNLKRAQLLNQKCM